MDMSGLQGAGKLWPGKDYVNFIHKDFIDVELAFSGILAYHIVIYVWV